MHKRHYGLAAIIVAAVIACGTSVHAMNVHFANEIAETEYESERKLAQMDKDIEYAKSVRVLEQKIKEDQERRAKEKAKREAEAKRRAAEEALRAQLAGQVVTPDDCAISGAHGNPSSIDVVINKKNCFNPINFVPSDLTSYNGYLVSAKILPSLKAMFNAAASAGKPLGLTSAYRSYSDQVVTYNNWVAVNGSYAAADTVSARPGYSEHQTGFAVDISGSGSSLNGFASTVQYTWMKSNAHKYGFVQRYKTGYESITGYSAEAWHWRYVGATVATDMKNRGVHTLEQYWGIEGGAY